MINSNNFGALFPNLSQTGGKPSVGSNLKKTGPVLFPTVLSNEAGTKRPSKVPPVEVLAAVSPGFFRVLNTTQPSNVKVLVLSVVNGATVGAEPAEVGKTYPADSVVLVPTNGSIKVQWSDGEVVVYTHAEHPKPEVLDADRAGGTFAAKQAKAQAAAEAAKTAQKAKIALGNAFKQGSKGPTQGTTEWTDDGRAVSTGLSTQDQGLVLSSGTAPKTQEQIDAAVLEATGIQTSSGKKLQLNLSDIQLQSLGQVMAAETDLYNVSFALVAKALSTLELPEAVQSNPQLQTCGAVIADQLVSEVLMNRAEALRGSVAQNIRTRLDAVRSMYAQIPPESRVTMTNLLQKHLDITCEDISKLARYGKNTPSSIYRGSAARYQVVKLDIQKYDEMQKEVEAAVTGASVPQIGADVLTNLYKAMVTTIEQGDLSGDLGEMSDPAAFFEPVFVPLLGVDMVKGQSGSFNVPTQDVLASAYFFPYEFCMQQWVLWENGYGGESAGQVGETIKGWFEGTTDAKDSNSFAVASTIWGRIQNDPRGLPWGCTSGSPEWYNSFSNRMGKKPLWMAFEKKALLRKGLTLTPGSMGEDPVTLTPPELLARITTATEAALTMLFNHAMTLAHLLVAIEGVTPDVSWPYQQFFTNGVGAPPSAPVDSVYKAVTLPGVPADVVKLTHSQPPAFQAAIVAALSSNEPEAFGPGSWFETWMKLQDNVPDSVPGDYYRKSASQLLNEAFAKSYEEIVIDFTDSNKPMDFAINVYALYEKTKATYEATSDPGRLAEACKGLDAGLISCITSKLQLEIFAILANEDSHHARNIVSLMNAQTNLLKDNKEAFDKMAARFVELVGNEGGDENLLRFSDYEGPGLLNQLRAELEAEKDKPLSERDEAKILQIQNDWSVLLQEMINLKAKLGDLTDGIVLQAIDSTETGNVGYGIHTVSESSVQGSLSQDGKSCLFNYIDENGEIVEGTASVSSSKDAENLNDDTVKTNEDTKKDLSDNFKDIKDTLDNVGSFGATFGFTFLNPGSQPLNSENDDSIKEVATENQEKTSPPPPPKEESGFPWFLLIGAGLAATGAAPLAVAGGVAALQLFMSGDKEPSSDQPT